MNFEERKKMWYSKYDILLTYLKENRKIPTSEMCFSDGTNMYRWYSTQKYAIKKPNKSNMNLDMKQIELVKYLEDLEENINIKNNLKCLYIAIINENSQEVYAYLKKLKDGKIIKNEKDKELFEKLKVLRIRVKRDGISSAIKHKSDFKIKKLVKGPSILSTNINNFQFLDLKRKKVNLEAKTTGFYLNYIRECLNLSSEEMANLLNCEKSSYERYERNFYPLTFNRKMQLLVIAQNFSNDEIILEMINEFKKELVFEDDIQYFLQFLVANFSLNYYQRNKRIQDFYLKYRIVKDVIPNEILSLNKMIQINMDLNEVLESEINKSEEKIIKVILNLLKNKILTSLSGKDIINKAFIALNIPVRKFYSAYTILESDAKILLEKLIFYKDEKKMEEMSNSIVNKAIELLDYAINPGKNLAYELLRYKECMGLDARSLSKKIGFNSSYISTMYLNEEISLVTVSKIVEYLFSNKLEDNDITRRFKNSFLNSYSKSIKK